LNGTWTCNVTVRDSANSVASSAGNNSVDQLVALTILEDTISFGTMSPGQNSSVANSTNVTNMGNVAIDIQVKANADMSCSGAGTIGVGNISYNVSSGNYDTMSVKKLSTYPLIEPAFDLGIEGIATSEGMPSTKKEYWTIKIPSGVRGTCNNSITVMASLDLSDNPCACEGTGYQTRNISGDIVYVDCNADKCWTPTALYNNAWGPNVNETDDSCINKGDNYPACDYCDDLNYGGFNDWTLPVMNVLNALRCSNSCSGGKCFGGEGSSGYYWSSTEDSSSKYFAWLVGGTCNDTIVNSKGAYYYYRCVRG